MSEFQSVMDTMRDYAWWKGERDSIIRRALALNIPVERISAAMDISHNTVYKVKKEMQSCRRPSATDAAPSAKTTCST